MHAQVQEALKTQKVVHYLDIDGKAQEMRKE